jgi:hypothetical protein
LHTLDLSNWSTALVGNLPANPSLGSFFADSARLYTEVQTNGFNRIVWTLATKTREQRFFPYTRGELTFHYWALDDQLMLGAGRNSNGSEALVRATLPSYDIVQRVPFINNANPHFSSRETPITVSGDRRTFAYGVDNQLIVRRCDNLEIIYKQELDLSSEMRLRRVALAADGARVAVSVANNLGTQDASYIYIYDCSDGKQIIRLNVCSMEGLAISPDLKFLAAGQRVAVRDKLSGTQPTVFLFEIASGKNVATLIHDQFYAGGKEFLYSGVSVLFTPDGKYLVTSGLNTRIWRII